MADAAHTTPTKKASDVLLWLVAIGFFMETLDATIVNTALPSMATSLGESALSMYAVVIAYSLTIAVLIPASGWVVDRFGTRKAFFSAILIFSLGSLLCALSRSLNMLILSRVIQGAGGAMLMPVGRLAVLRAYPGQRFLQAISFVTVPALVGPLIGPTLGGWLVEIASWHWIFLINIPVGLIGCIATYTHMPDSRSASVPRFDLSGYVMLAISMVAISLSLDGLSSLGLQHATILILLMFGLAGLVSYWLHAAKTVDPLFPIELFRIRTYGIGLLGNLFARIGSSSMPFLIPLLLQLTLGYSPFQAGLTMLPVALAGIAAKRLATPLITLFGYRKVLVSNTLLVGLAMGSFALISREQPTWIRIIQLLFFGGVNSLQFTAMNTLTLKDLGNRASSGNSLFSMVQMLAISLGVVAAGALLSTFTAEFGGHHDTGQALKAFHATFICVGLVTCTSAWIFWQLSPDMNEPPRKDATVDVG